MIVKATDLAVVLGLSGSRALEGSSDQISLCSCSGFLGQFLEGWDWYRLARPGSSVCSHR